MLQQPEIQKRHKGVYQPEAHKRIAVLVLNFNGAHFLPDCFRSLQEITEPAFETYLIDNASSDSSIEWTKSHYPQVSIVENDINLGFSEAYDRIIRMLDHEYVVLLNNDTVVEKEWLRALYEVAEGDPSIGACGSKILMEWDRSIVDHGGGLLTIVGSGLDLNKWQQDRPGPDETQEVGFACGCSMLLRRRIYLEVGGFDPDYFMYHEDVDLCWRMRLFGYSVVYVPKSIVYHSLGGGKVRSIENPMKVYHGQANRLANILKNLGPVELPWALLISAGYDAVRTIRFIVIRRFDLLKMLVKGYTRVLCSLKSILSKRRYIQSHRKVWDRDLKKFFYPLVSSVLDYRRLLNIQDR